jgi:hypothetical protein
MFRFQIRDLLWLTILAAVLVTWRIQWRANEQARLRDAQTIQTLKQQAASVRVIYTLVRPPQVPEGLRRIPGEWDYQAPPERPRLLKDAWPEDSTK